VHLKRRIQVIRTADFWCILDNCTERPDPPFYDPFPQSGNVRRLQSLGDQLTTHFLFAFSPQLVCSLCQTPRTVIRLFLLDSVRYFDANHMLTMSTCRRIKRSNYPRLVMIILILCSLCLASNALRMDVKHCGNFCNSNDDEPEINYDQFVWCDFQEGGQVNEVRATGCEDDKQPCRIRRGSSPRLEVDFVSPFQARFVRADVRGKLEGTERLPVYIPWAGMHRNACDGHGLTCPLKRNSKYTYHYEMPVGSSTPTFKTEYTWRLSNAWGFTIACFSMPLEIF
jgi:hypothetical protein